MENTKTLQVSTPNDREIVMTRVFDAPRTLVFDAWTQCEHLKRWMLGPEGWSMPICEIDLKPGGASRLVWRRADGSKVEVRGEYREVLPPERLVFTESWGVGWPETVNTLILSEEDGRTTTTLTVVYPSKEARDAALDTGAADGLEQGYRRLDDYLPTIQ